MFILTLRLMGLFERFSGLVYNEYRISIASCNVRRNVGGWGCYVFGGCTS